MSGSLDQAAAPNALKDDHRNTDPWNFEFAHNITFAQTGHILRNRRAHHFWRASLVLEVSHDRAHSCSFEHPRLVPLINTGIRSHAAGIHQSCHANPQKQSLREAQSGRMHVYLAP
jgi:hypothetical protein